MKIFYYLLTLLLLSHPVLALEIFAEAPPVVSFEEEKPQPQPQPKQTNPQPVIKPKAPQVKNELPPSQPVTEIKTTNEVNTTIVEDVSCKNAGYENGIFVQSCDNNFKLKTNIQLQPQYQALVMEGQENVHTFQIRRGRIIFAGHAFDPDLTFKFQYEAIGGRDSTTREGELRGNSLRDAYLNYKFSDYVEITGGQFKPFYNREELVSSSKFQFVALSMTNEVFTNARDIGLGVHGRFLDNKLEYGASITNEGLGHNTTNANNEILFAGRLVWDVLGTNTYSQSALSQTEDHNLSLGIGMLTNRPASSSDATIFATTGDAVYRYRGLSLEGAIHFARNITDSMNLLGFVTQVGYFIIPEKFEVALRYAAVIPTTYGVDDGYEYTAGLNYFFKGHNLKVQMDYSVLVNSALIFQDAAAPTHMYDGAFSNGGFNLNQLDHRLRTQVSLYF